MIVVVMSGELVDISWAKVRQNVLHCNLNVIYIRPMLMHSLGVVIQANQVSLSYMSRLICHMWHDIGPKFLGCRTVHWCTWCTLDSYIGKYTVYMGVHIIVHECTWMYMGVRECTRVYIGVHECIWGSTWVYMGVHGCT